MTYKGRNTRILSVRVPLSVYAMIEQEAKRRGFGTISDYVNEIFQEKLKYKHKLPGIRQHSNPRHL